MESKAQYDSALEKRYKPWAIVLSVVIPVVVGVLFSAPKVEGYDLSFLPGVYAAINGCVAILLVLAVMAIKKKNKRQHERYIKLAILGSVLFLVGYVLYHLTSDATLYGDVDHSGIVDDAERAALGNGAYVYYFILFTHIILSVAIIPFVLFTYLRGWSGNYDKHKKMARYTFPLWLYVAVSGVVVYLMISPFYA